jgi:hypothetical protein
VAAAGLEAEGLVEGGDAPDVGGREVELPGDLGQRLWGEPAARLLDVLQDRDQRAFPAVVLGDDALDDARLGHQTWLLRGHGSAGKSAAAFFRIMKGINYRKAGKLVNDYFNLGNAASPIR